MLVRCLYDVGYVQLCCEHFRVQWPASSLWEYCSEDFDAAGHRVNLLFDRETEAIKVESPYTQPELRVTVKRPGPLWVRVPPWADVSRIIGLGTQEPVRCVSGYLFIARPPVNAPLVLELPLAEQELTLDHRARQIWVQLRGIDHQYGFQRHDALWQQPRLCGEQGRYMGADQVERGFTSLILNHCSRESSKLSACAALRIRSAFPVPRTGTILGGYVLLDSNTVSRSRPCRIIWAKASGSLCSWIAATARSTSYSIR